MSYLYTTEIKQIREIRFSHGPRQCTFLSPDMHVARSRNRSRGPQSCQGSDKQIQWGFLHRSHHLCMGLDHRELFFSHKGDLNSRESKIAALLFS